MSNLSPRGRTTIVTLLVSMTLGLGAVACSSTPEVTDPTTTIQALTGTTSTTRASTTTEGTTRTTGTQRPPDSDDPDPVDDQLPTGDETVTEYADALIASFDGDPDEIFTIDVVRCVSPKWVEAIGVEPFQEAGITPDEVAAGNGSIDDVEIDQLTAEAIVDAVPACGLELIDLFIDGLGSSVADQPDRVACVKANVSADQVRETLVSQIRGERGTDPEDLVATCLD